MAKPKLTAIERSKQEARRKRDVQEVRNRIELSQRGLNPSRSQAAQMGEDEVTQKLEEVGKDGPAWRPSTVEELTGRKARRLFDRLCREELGVSREEFLQRYEANDIPPEWTHDRLIRVEILMPFGR